MMIILDLVHPPSVNKTRKHDPATLSAYKAWHRACDQLVLTQKRGRLPKIKGPWQATITLRDDASRADMDNGIKATIDYAVRINLVEGDSRKIFRRLVVEFGEAPHGCRIKVEQFGQGNNAPLDGTPS
jgi:hypothetical protein